MNKTGYVPGLQGEEIGQIVVIYTNSMTDSYNAEEDGNRSTNMFSNKK